MSLKNKIWRIFLILSIIIGSYYTSNKIILKIRDVYDIYYLEDSATSLRRIIKGFERKLKKEEARKNPRENIIKQYKTIIETIEYQIQEIEDNSMDH